MKPNTVGTISGRTVVIPVSNVRAHTNTSYDWDDQKLYYWVWGSFPPLTHDASFVDAELRYPLIGPILQAV